MASLARSAVAGLLLCAAHSVPGARAQSDALQLSWQAPAGCPSEAEVLAEARRVVGTATEASAPISVRATVEQREAKYALHLVTSYRGQRGERTLLARECRALMQSVTLVLGVLLGQHDDEAAQDGPASDDDEVQATDSGRDAEPAAAVEPAATPAEGAATTTDASAQPNRGDDERDERDDHDDDASPDGSRELEPSSPARSPSAGNVHFSLLLGAGVHAGLLPALAPAALLGVELGVEPLSIGLQLSGSPALGERPLPGVRTQLDGAGLALRGCYGAALGALGGGLCTGVRAHALRGRASGPASIEGSAVAPWYALSAGGHLSWPRATELRLRLWADAALSLDRPRFVVDGLGSVHRVAAVVGELGLGAVWSP